jgi:hypothetical protein
MIWIENAQTSAVCGIDLALARIQRQGRVIAVRHMYVDVNSTVPPQKKIPKNQTYVSNLCYYQNHAESVKQSENSSPTEGVSAIGSGRDTESTAYSKARRTIRETLKKPHLSRPYGVLNVLHTNGLPC